MIALRSLLFIPGNKTNMLEKAAGFSPDVLVPDMEDSVPEAEKIRARETVSQWLPRYRAHAAAVMPRINALETGLLEDDLAAVVGPDIWGISVGKVSTASEISQISNVITILETKAGLAPGQISLIPWIETARAIVNCSAILAASSRIVAAAFGAEDYCNDLGIERLDDGSELLYARSALCTAARAADVPALDTPFFRFRDEQGLRTDSAASKRLGFKGRFAIHPAQVDPINESFAPSTAEIAHARRVIAAFDEAEKAGRGSTSLDGRVIDVPVVKRARALLALAEQISK